MQHIYATDYAFAALKNGGCVVSWGSAGYLMGESVALGFEEVQKQLASDVQHIYSSEKGFCCVEG